MLIIHKKTINTSISCESKPTASDGFVSNDSDATGLGDGKSSRGDVNCSIIKAESSHRDLDFNSLPAVSFSPTRKLK